MNHMTEADLQQALARGEDSRQQFKRDATNADGMALVVRGPCTSVKNFGRNFGTNLQAFVLQSIEVGKT
jgi:hypothetical protein